MRLDFHNGGRTLKARYERTVRKKVRGISPFRAVPVVGFLHRRHCRRTFPNLSHRGSPKREDAYELKVPFAAYKAIIRDTKISNDAFRVWHLLQDMADDEGVCWPGQMYISKTLKCDLKSVRVWIQELISNHYLERTFGEGHHSIYKVLCGGKFPLSKGENFPVQQGKLPVSDGEKFPTNVTHIKGTQEGNLSATETVVWSRELERVEDAIQSIRNSYDSHQEWDADDKFALRELKKTRQDIRGKLGLP